MTSWNEWFRWSQSRAISRSWRPSWLISTSFSVARWKRRSARSSSARSSSVIFGVAISVARLSSSARTMNASRISSRERERTRTPRLGSNVTRPSAASRRRASRTGVRLTRNWSERCSCRSVLPGGISPETIASSSASAMSSAFVPSDISSALVSDQLRIRGEREEIDEDLVQRDLLEHVARFSVHRLIGQLRHDLEDDPLHVRALDTAVANPLPDLRARDLRRRGVLHQVVDRCRSDALEPRRDVADPDGHVGSHAGVGDLARGRRDVQKIRGLRGHVFAQALELVRTLAENRVELSHRDGYEIGMRDPRSVESVARLAGLVLADACERELVHLRIATARDERRHAADRVRAALVARPDEELRVRPHERDGHRHLSAVRKHEVRAVTELLDHGEDVVPAPRVQAGG